MPSLYASRLISTQPKLKTLFCKESAPSLQEIERSIGALLTRLTPTECCNFASDAGYASTRSYCALMRHANGPGTVPWRMMASVGRNVVWRRLIDRQPVAWLGTVALGQYHLAAPLHRPSTHATA